MSRAMDYHLHSIHSFDGDQTIPEACRAMLKQGVQEVCFTEHIEPGHPDPDCDVPPIWDVYLHELALARAEFPMLTIRAGVEIGDNPPFREQVRRELDSLDLDFHLLSLHLVDGIDPYDAERFYAGRTRAQAYRAYAEAKAESVLSWDSFDAVAHIGYVARYGPYPMAEKPLRYSDAPDAFDSILRHIIAHDAALEVNTGGVKATGAPLPDRSIISRYIELGGVDFTFGSDAHNTARCYEGIEAARAMVKELGGRWQLSFDRRKRIRHPL